MGDPLSQGDNASTPLTEEEREALIPSYITLRSELNEAEQRNILAAEEWAVSLHPKVSQVLDFCHVVQITNKRYWFHYIRSIGLPWLKNILSSAEIRISFATRSQKSYAIDLISSKFSFRRKVILGGVKLYGNTSPPLLGAKPMAHMS